jgi:hypothetical protein
MQPGTLLPALVRWPSIAIDLAPTTLSRQLPSGRRFRKQEFVV